MAHPQHFQFPTSRYVPANKSQSITRPNTQPERGIARSARSSNHWTIIYWVHAISYNVVELRNNYRAEGLLCSVVHFIAITRNKRLDRVPLAVLNNSLCRGSTRLCTFPTNATCPVRSLLFRPSKYNNSFIPLHYHPPVMSPYCFFSQNFWKKDA